eukprot:8781853-Alexandrium_andersonii.AAC.1
MPGPGPSRFRCWPLEGPNLATPRLKTGPRGPRNGHPKSPRQATRHQKSGPRNVAANHADVPMSVS